jgi:hypothetical protein
VIDDYQSENRKILPKIDNWIAVSGGNDAASFGDARGVQLTVPNGLAHNEVVMALKRLEFTVMRGR